MAGGIGGAISGAAAGGLAGIPSTSSQSGRSTTTGNSSTETNASQSGSSSSQLQALLNFLQSVSGATTAQQTTTPNLSPAGQSYINQLISKMSGLNVPSLTGYTAGQTANINANAGAQEQAVANIMASRGLSTSPAAATAQAGIEQNRLNQITGMEQQAPLTLQQMQLANINPQLSLASILPSVSGTSTTGATTSQQQTQSQQQQEQYQQAWQNLYNYLYSANASQQTTVSEQQAKQGSWLNSLLGVLGGAAMGFLSDERLKHDIKPMDSKSIDKIVSLIPKTWEWNGGHVKDSGFIAQEVEKVFPELVHEDYTHGPVPLKKVNYVGMIPHIVRALQDVNARLEDMS